MRPLTGLHFTPTSSPSVALSWATSLLMDAGATSTSDADISVAIPLTVDGGDALEADAAALTGLWELPVGGGTKPIPAHVASAVAGSTAAIGVIAAHLGGRRTVTVPLVDAALAALELTALLTDAPPTSWSPLQWAASPLIGAYRASDGWIYVHAGLASHLARLVPILEPYGGIRPSAATLADPARVGSPSEAIRLHRELADVLRKRTAAAWEDLLGGAGLCAVRIRASWDGPPAPTPIFTDLRARAPRPLVGPLPLSGVRVLDWTQVIAGPSAARALAELGAEVVRIENPRQEAGWADAFHAAFSPGKRLVHADATTPAGAREIRDLVEGWRPDVVIDGLRRGVTERLLGPAWWGDAVPVRISAYGPGPWADRPGWEQTVQAATGLQVAYGGAVPDLVPVPVTDLCTGLLAAFGALCSLAARQDGRPSPSVEASLLGTATRLVAAGVPGQGTRPKVRRSAAIAATPLRIRTDHTRIGGILRLDGKRLPDLAGAQPRRPPVRGPSRIRWRLDQLRWAVAVAVIRARR